MEQEPLISVIIPVYKVEEYLPKCLDSVVGQTYRNLEIILVDDGSPDNCGRICDEYAAKDTRISVIHKENGGLSDARNAGLDIATGEYIGFVDSDDYIAPDLYEVLMSELLENSADISVCSYYRVTDKIIPSCPSIEKKKLNASDGLKEIIYSKKYGMMAWAKLYRADLFTNIRYPRGHVCEDVYVIADIFENVKTVIFDTKPLYYYVQRSESVITSKFSKNTLDWIYSYEHLYDKICQCFPELKHVAKIRLLWGRTFVLDRSILTNERQLNRKIQRDIRRNIRLIIDPFFTLKRKLMTLIACVSLKLYKICIVFLSR